MVSRLQLKASQIGNILTSLEKKYGQANSNTIREENEGGPDMKKSNSTSQILHNDHINSMAQKRFSMKIDPIPPFNPNKQRKTDESPQQQTEKLQIDQSNPAP